MKGLLLLLVDVTKELRICFNVPSLKAFFSCCDMGETFIYDRLSISQVYKSHWFRLNCLWKTLNLVFKIKFFSQSSNLTHKSYQTRYKNDLRMSYIAFCWVSTEHHLSFISQGVKVIESLVRNFFFEYSLATKIFPQGRWELII